MSSDSGARFLLSVSSRQGAQPPGEVVPARALHHPICVSKSRYAVRPRVVEFRLQKSEEKVWWPRLLATKERQHWLRIDFQNWKDEDDQEDDKDPFEEEKYQPMTTDWSKHISANIAKGSSLRPMGQSVMGGALGKAEGAEQGDDGGLSGKSLRRRFGGQGCLQPKN